jgi:hypothetical protein
MWTVSNGSTGEPRRPSLKGNMAAEVPDLVEAAILSSPRYARLLELESVASSRGPKAKQLTKELWDEWARLKCELAACDSIPIETRRQMLRQASHSQAGDILPLLRTLAVREDQPPDLRAAAQEALRALLISRRVQWGYSTQKSVAVLSVALLVLALSALIWLPSTLLGFATAVSGLLVSFECFVVLITLQATRASRQFLKEAKRRE